MADANITRARNLLRPADEKPGHYAVLGAAAMSALAAVLLAGIMVLGPGVRFDEPAISTERQGWAQSDLNG